MANPVARSIRRIEGAIELVQQARIELQQNIRISRARLTPVLLTLPKSIEHPVICPGNRYRDGIGMPIPALPVVDSGIDFEAIYFISGQNPMLEDAVEVPRLGEVVQLLDSPILDDLFYLRSSSKGRLAFDLLPLGLPTLRLKAFGLPTLRLLTLAALGLGPLPGARPTRAFPARAFPARPQDPPEARPSGQARRKPARHRAPRI